MTTIGQLLAELKKYPDTTPVFTTDGAGTISSVDVRAEQFPDLGVLKAGEGAVVDDDGWEATYRGVTFPVVLITAG